MSCTVFITGGTGYLGRPLIEQLLELISSTRAQALRLGLVTHAQMLAALVRAVEQPAQGIRIVDVPELRKST